jgi:DNA-binding transcriptional LysR family regulator
VIDFRHQTFLALCEIKNYTKTAEYLHITQPAVTQHIQYLEEKYNCKLFRYENKKIELTFQGEQLRAFLIRIVADITHFNRNVNKTDPSLDSIIFGATLSVGEYMMPKVLTKLIEKRPGLNIHMEVHNTQVLLEKLRRGDIDFAIVEGVFDKSNYHSILFSLERFIPICATNSHLANKDVSFNDILQSSLVLREKGSGTREILENILKQYNYSLNSFNNIIEIGNMSAIKELVASNICITFLYEIVAKKEIENGDLSMIKISDFDIKREFNFVFLKNSFYESKYIEYFHLMKEAYLVI